MNKLLTITILLTAFSCKADFNQALDSYENKDYKSAYTAFKKMAHMGEKRSQFNLGVMYLKGEYAKQDINLAYAWIKLAANSDTLNAPAKSVLKTISNDLPDIQTAEQSYQKLAELYSSDVLINDLYPEFLSPKNSNAFNAKPVKIIEPKYPKRALRKGLSGWTKFQFDVDTKGVPRNIELRESYPNDVFTHGAARTIAKWRFEPAFDDSGKPVEQKKLRYTLAFSLHKDGLPVNPQYYQKLKQDAEDGLASAQYQLGALYQTPTSLENDSNPNEWYLKASTQGHPIAQYELGRSLIFGQGCKTDKTKGVEWLTQAAQSGQKNAKELLANLLSGHSDLASQTKANDYFSSIDDLSPSATLDYAKMLLASSHEEIKNPKLVLKLAKQLEDKLYWDDTTIAEISAAAYAAQGDFKKAVNLQEDALEEAEDRAADLAGIRATLAGYQKQAAL